MSIHRKLLSIGGLMLCILSIAVLALALTDNSSVGLASEPQEHQQPFSILPVGENPATIINGGDSELPTANAIATICHGEWMGPATSFVPGWYMGLEYYAVYQDPRETGCPPPITYPFQVNDVYWEVFNPGPGPLNIDLQPVIYNVDWLSPICTKPGEVCCYGKVFNLNIPAGLVRIILPIDCCVYGPYYAGVYSPNITGTGWPAPVIDNAPPPFGIRSCASYNNQAGSWVDLTTAVPGFTNLRLWSDGAASDANRCDPCVYTIEPGVDLWTTPSGTSFDNHFTVMPIPADFFNPGSDPFFGSICLQGSPLNTNPAGVLGRTDTIIKRLASCSLPLVPDACTVPIEIIALSLVSCSPITVTSILDPPSQWDVQITLSSNVPQQQGQMTVRKECCNGGTFTSILHVTPKFIFTEVGNPTNMRVLDLGGFLPPIQFGTNNGYWSYDVPPPFDLVTSPGLVSVDHDLFLPTRPILIPPSSKFTPGMRTLPCNPLTPNDPYCGGKVLTREQEQLAQHGVLPPQENTPQEGACCLPDGSCIVTDPTCCNRLGGIYLGDYVPCPLDCSPDTLYDTLCTRAVITITLNPGDFGCVSSLSPISMVAVPSTVTVVCRTPGPPYIPGQIIQTEMLQMSLQGADPTIGRVILRESPTMPSRGFIQVTNTNPGGGLTLGESFFDVFFDITLPDIGQAASNPNPTRMHATLTSLPPGPMTSFQKVPGSPDLLLHNPGGFPVGFLCDATHTIISCECCVGLRGDANNDRTEANILDLNYTVNKIFRRGPLAVCFQEGNPNGDGFSLNILDLNYLVNKIFRRGPLPVPCPAR